MPYYMRLSHYIISWSFTTDVEIQHSIPNLYTHGQKFIDLFSVNCKTHTQKNFLWIFLTRYVDGMPTSEITPLTIWYIHPPHHGWVMVMNDRLTSLSFHGNQQSAPPPPPHTHTHTHTIPQIRLFQTLTLKLQGQGHGWGQRSRSHNSPSIQPMHLLFVSYQLDQSFLRYVK